MLKDFLKRLGGEAAAPLPPEDARIAIAALLVIAAHADGEYLDSERAMIERVLTDRYGLDDAAAKTLRGEGEAAEAAAMDMYKFTSLIKQAIPYEQRAGVLEALWRVVLADSVREAHEETLMRRVTDLLGLDARESHDARRRVQG